MDGAHGCVLIVLVVGVTYMRNFFLPEIAEVVLTQVPQVSHIATSRRGQEPMPGAELSEVDILRAVSILIRLLQVDT